MQKDKAGLLLESRSQDAGGRDAPANRITIRCLLIGALSVAALSVINPWAYWALDAWNVGSGQLMNGPVLVLFLLVVLNTLLIRVWPGQAFSRTELLVIYGMLIVSLGLLQQGGLPYLVALTTYPYYAASPENQWAQLLLPHIPVWFQVRGMAASVWVWEGMPKGTSIPWGAWLRPWLAWGAFTFAFMAAMYCLAALLSRDWIHKQRLTFPLVEVPMALASDPRAPALGTSLFRSRIFWAGFGIPAFLGVLGWLHRFFPDVPAPQLWGIDVGRQFSGMGLPWSALSDTHLSLIFAVLGVMCLLPSEVVLSLWVFYVAYKVELLVWAACGVTPGGSRSFVDPRLFVSYREAGAFMAMSAILLYQSRQYLRRAWLTLIGRDREDDLSPYAPLSGRAALVGLVASCAFMLWFGVKVGMAWWLFALLFGVFFTVLLGSTRLVAAAGVLYPDTGRYGYSFLFNMIGARGLSPASLVPYTYFSFIFMQDPMNVAMPQMMNSFRLTESGRIGGRSFSFAAGLAIATVIVAGIGGILHMLYHRGASQLDPWPFYSWANWAFYDLSSTLRNPELPSNYLRAAVGVGALIAAALVLLNSYTVWWPLSPVGFLIASTYTEDWILWFNAFLAWLVTSQLKRYGGLKLYRSFRPAFIGLILGDYLSSGLFAIIDTAMKYARVAGR